MNQIDNMIEFEQNAMQRSTQNALHYMKQAKTDIDAFFSVGYAEQHPELIAAYMQTAAADFSTRAGLFEVCEAINELSISVSTAIDLHRIEG